ncbi:MAG: hypothetical protein H6631_00710 [Anaerolineaceae bacterium]|nr:hypothetical protein [Anaerolineaceae bacterium]
MSNSDHLEIISTNGEVIFYVLDPTQGLTNIGSDPDNHIVIDDRRVAPFQAVLDHRQKPYRLILLTHEGRPLLAGNVLPPDKSVELHNWDQLEFGSYTLVLVESQAGGPSYSQPAQPAAGTPVYDYGPTHPQIAPPTSRPEQEPDFGPGWGQPSEPAAGRIVSTRPGVGQFEMPVYDQEDEAIYIQLSEREWIVNLEQNETAIYELEITNRGNRVANFGVFVYGLDQRWVQMSAPQINLRERQSGAVSIAITPPKAPTSYAGPHYFAVVVNSPNYDNRYSQLGAMLEILPYYQFSVNELSPKVRTISWFKRSGDTSIVVTNLGNSQTAYQLEGGDRENACNYEFQIPGESVTLANQAALHLLPEGRRDDAIDPDIQLEPHRTVVPITVIPNSRPLFLRQRVHHYEIRAIPAEGQQGPKSQLGELRQRPLFGIIPIMLMTLLLLFLCSSGVWLLFGPRIYTFTVDGEMRTKTINSGDDVTLGWEASPFANLRITTSTGADIGRLDDNIGERDDKPLQSTIYTLEANNILSPLYFFLGDWMKEERRVRVIPVEPSIREFTIEPDHIVLGEEAILSWNVENADEVALSTGSGLPEPIATEQYMGQRLVSPSENTTFSMQANNFNGQTSKNAAITVVTPTGTPVPPPEVQFFNVNPSQIIQGESVTLNWSVANADSVVINPIPGSLPPSGNISQSPQDTILYVLEARKVGAAPISRIQEVAVIIPTGTPSPTATPAAPLIVDFAASDDTLVIGGENGDETVTLFWTVQGDVTDIQLSNSQNVIIQSQLTPAAQIDVPVDEDTKLFTLIAYNQDKSNRKSVTLDIQTPTPEPTPEPPPTPTPPPPNILFFQAVAADPADDDEIECTQTDEDRQTCNVTIGTKINLSWEVQDASEVSLKFNDSDLGNQPLSSERRETIRQDGTYVLAAENNGNPERVTKQVQIIAEDDIPNSPTNIEGTTITTNSITIEWDYNRNEENKIIGFRLYRANDPPFNTFARIADEVDLPPGERMYVDTPLNPTCGRAYYIVAVFEDVDGNRQETDASANSWFSPPC